MNNSIKTSKVLKTFYEDNKTIFICKTTTGYCFIKTVYHIPVRDDYGIQVVQKTFYNFNYKNEPLNVLIYRYKNNLLDV